jgi:ribonuclease BN (tRNA processing enzyme)
LQYRLNRYLSPPLFPLHFRDLPCKVHLHEISHSSFEINSFQVDSNYISHPGPTIGYRISNDKHVFAYLPDHEPFIGGFKRKIGKEWISGIGLAEKADLLIHDSQYTVEEYQNKIGWGHSTIEDAIQFASLAKAKRLLLFHHDPYHTDSVLDGIYAKIQQYKKLPLNIELAKEGDVFELG